METINSAAPNPKSEIHWPSVWQLGFSLIGSIILWGLSLIMLIAAVNGQLLGDNEGAITLLLNAAGTAFSGVLLIPSAVYALYRILDKPVPFSFHLQRPAWLILALPPLLLMGYIAAKTLVGSFVVLPFIHVAAAATSVLFFLALGLRGVELWRPQLTWGIFNLGLIGAPFLSLIGELAALIILGSGVLVFLLGDPQNLQTLLELTENLSVAPSDTAFDLLAPYLSSPVVILGGLFFGAILVPIIEEIFKPIGVLLLLRRTPKAVDGFAAGLLSGAGYALFENFSLGAGAGEDWALVTMARAGTSLIHIVTAGLTGWAFTEAWTQKRFGRLVVAYFLAVGIHAMWNGIVILTTFASLSTMPMELPAYLPEISSVAPIGFALIIIGCFVLLIGMNAALRPTKENKEPVLVEPRPTP
jgi:hypothetical protein